MATKFVTNLNLNENQIINGRFEVLATDPTNGNFEGRMIYRSDLDVVKYHDGASWQTLIIGVQAAGDYADAVTISNNSDGTVSITLNLANTETAGLLSSTFWDLLNGATSEATGSTLAKRDSSGQIKVATTPTDDNHAASKKYVDDAIVSITVSTEAVQDIVAEQFVTNGTHAGITATYDDAGDGAIDLALDSTYSPTFTGITINNDSNNPVFSVDENNTQVIFYSQDGTEKAHTEVVNGGGAFRIVTTDDLALRANSGDIILYPGEENGNTGKAFVGWGNGVEGRAGGVTGLENEITTAGNTQDLTNKTIADATVYGTTSFKDATSGDAQYLFIEQSYTGTARVTAADDLALRSQNGDIILYPGSDDGGTGKAYIHWGDDAWNAYPDREIATIGTSQTFSGKTLTDMTLGGDLDADSYKVINLANPDNNQDAATKYYVDSKVSGLTWKNAANLLVDSNVDVEQDFVGVVIDDHNALTLSDVGYRLLLIGQGTGSENGIYETYADGSYLYIRRTTDADTYQELIGAAIFVSEGDVYGATSWTQNNTYLTSFSDQSWVQFAGQGVYLAGHGIDIASQTISVKLKTAGGVQNGLQTSDDGLTILLGTSSGLTLGDSMYPGLKVRLSGSGGLTIDAGGISLSSSVAGSGLTYTDGVLSVDAIDLGFGSTDITGTLAIGHGGTGATTYAGARTSLALPGGTYGSDHGDGSEPVLARTVAKTIGDSENTSFTVTHNFGTRDVVIQVVDTSTHETVFADTVRNTIDQVTVSFSVAPANNAYRVVVTG